MHQVDRITIQDGSLERFVSLWQGSPAEILPEDPVDLVVVSAFKNDYSPTPESVIGAFHRKGLSVASLAQNKAVDLRSTAGFWLSQPLVESPVGVGRILCFEPHFLGTQPAEVVGHLFRGLFPFLSDTRNATVAMAVLASGAIGADRADMLRALVSAAIMWMKRGLPVRELRIFEKDAGRIAELARTFAELKPLTTPVEEERSSGEFDVFLSF